RIGGPAPWGSQKADCRWWARSRECPAPTSARASTATAWVSRSSARRSSSSRSRSRERPPQERDPVLAHDPVDLGRAEVLAQHPVQPLHLFEVADGAVPRVDAAIEVGAEADMLRTPGGAGVVNRMADHVVEACPALRPEVVWIEADADDASAARDLGGRRARDLAI